MTTKDEALKLLEGAANYIDVLGGDSRKYRQALAAPVQEPVAITEQMAFAFHDAISDGAIGTDDLMDIMRGLEAAFAHITTPSAAAQRQFVGLTADDVPSLRAGDHAFLAGAQWAEAKLKEKNT